jgi:hypothetical protein
MTTCPCARFVSFHNFHLRLAIVVVSFQLLFLTASAVPAAVVANEVSCLFYPISRFGRLVRFRWVRIGWYWVF